MAPRHGAEEFKQSPIARGFDRFYGTRNFIDSYFTVLRNCQVYLDDKEVLPATESPVNHLHPDREWYTTDAFTDYALHFMDESFEKHPDKPLFLSPPTTLLISPCMPVRKTPKSTGDASRTWDGTSSAGNATTAW